VVMALVTSAKLLYTRLSYIRMSYHLQLDKLSWCVTSHRGELILVIHQSGGKMSNNEAGE